MCSSFWKASFLKAEIPEPEFRVLHKCSGKQLSNSRLNSVFPFFEDFFSMYSRSSFPCLIVQEQENSLDTKTQLSGPLGGSAGESLPSAQGVTLGSWDRVPHWAPCMEPASPSACLCLFLSVSLMNK